jgi:hypothetical protein
LIFLLIINENNCLKACWTSNETKMWSSFSLSHYEPNWCPKESSIKPRSATKRKPKSQENIG